MRTSNGEQKVASLLKRNGIPFKTEIMFKGLVGKKHIQLRYDFAIIKNNKVFINGYIEDNVLKVKCINIWK